MRTPTVKINGWTFDPTNETWVARIESSRWLIVQGSIEDAPHFTPSAAK